MNFEFPNKPKDIKVEIKLSKFNESTTVIEFMMLSGEKKKFEEFVVSAEYDLKER